MYDYVLRTNGWIQKSQFLLTCMLTRYLCLPIFIQILNVLDLQFLDQRFESNTLASANVKRVVFVGMAETTQVDDTTRGDVTGCQDMSRSVFKPNEMHDSVAYCIRRSVSVYVCVFIGMIQCEIALPSPKRLPITKVTCTHIETMDQRHINTADQSRVVASP